MIRRFMTAAVLLGGLLLAAGCAERGPPTIPETDEPLYVQGVQLNRQNRKGEALAAFLRVIDKRGERGAPESHLEAAAIHLHHSKEPVLAYYHFKRYLELQPNSKEAPRVRAMLDAALREVAARFPGRPVEDQSVRLAVTEEVSRLRRENEELRAELQTLRGGGARLPTRNARMIALPEPVAAAAPPPVVTAAPAAEEPAIRPVPPVAVPRVAAPAFTPAPAAKAGKSGPAAGRTAAGSGRTHTVRPKETLYGISRQYGVNLEDLVRANGIANPSAVPVGTVLRIP